MRRMASFPPKSTFQRNWIACSLPMPIEHLISVVTLAKYEEHLNRCFVKELLMFHPFSSSRTRRTNTLAKWKKLVKCLCHKECHHRRVLVSSRNPANLCTWIFILLTVTSALSFYLINILCGFNQKKMKFNNKRMSYEATRNETSGFSFLFSSASKSLPRYIVEACRNKWKISIKEYQWGAQR